MLGSGTTSIAVLRLLGLPAGTAPPAPFFVVNPRIQPQETAMSHVGLSAYALTTKKDFSFMGGFLLVGILLAFLAGLAAVFFEIPALSLTVSAAFVLLMSGLILYETSHIIHGGETNYVLATVTLFVSIFNLFASLLQLLGFRSGND